MAIIFRFLSTSYLHYHTLSAIHCRSYRNLLENKCAILVLRFDLKKWLEDEDGDEK